MYKEKCITKMTYQMFKVRIALVLKCLFMILKKKKKVCIKELGRGNKRLKRLRNNKETIYPTETVSDTKRDDVEHS